MDVDELVTDAPALMEDAEVGYAGMRAQPDGDQGRREMSRASPELYALLVPSVRQCGGVKPG